MGEVVGEGLSPVRHPKWYGEQIYMESAKQLIEGHNRLACLLGMIENHSPILMESHKVWVVRF